MSEVLVQNLRDPSQTISVMVTIKRMVISEEGSGGPLWVLEASTKEMDADGNPIRPVRKWLSNRTTLSDDVEEIINDICKKVNWSYYPDVTPPQVSGHWPIRDAAGVDIDTDISINLTEEIPSSGIDLNSIRVKVKGFDLTDQITIKGNMSSCTITLTPGTKFMSAVNEDFANGSEYPSS